MLCTDTNQKMLGGTRGAHHSIRRGRFSHLRANWNSPTSGRKVFSKTVAQDLRTRPTDPDTPGPRSDIGPSAEDQRSPSSPHSRKLGPLQRAGFEFRGSTKSGPSRQEWTNLPAGRPKTPLRPWTACARVDQSTAQRAAPRTTAVHTKDFSNSHA